MKTQYKNHIKFGSCWYDNFFKINTRQIQNKNQLPLTKSLEEQKTKTNELKRK
ncbi:hypothetical protein BH10BAC1_BH10BAC1_18690 [soil metagenome]